MSNKKGFTLAEALLTLTIIGVIAVLTIPSVIHNYKEAQYKLGAKKAVKALNEAISLNIAMGRKSPLRTTEDNNLFEYLQQAMSVVRSTTRLQYNKNAMAFYTKDGMRYEFPTTPAINGGTFSANNGKCATPGGNVQDDLGTVYDKPCLIIVDVNGQRRPNPRKTAGSYKVPAATGRSKILDVFPIIVTDKNAYPYGVVAQRAMFQHD